MGALGSISRHRGHSVNFNQASDSDLRMQLERLQDEYDKLKCAGLNLDLTRGKPNIAQVSLAGPMDGCLKGDFISDEGVDVRNYGGLDGLLEARQLFGSILGAPAKHVLIGGNGSLTLMYQTVQFALQEGTKGPDSAWKHDGQIKFLCPSPGYDRHFSICEHLGIELLAVPMLDTGPDMDVIEDLVQQDSQIKGIWCVPRFSNPTGCVYSDETVRRIANLGRIAGKGFAVMWDNAYAVHALTDTAQPLASIYDYCEEYDTQDSVFQFGSTSKMTFAGSGVCFMSSSEANLSAFKRHLAFQTIGPDKVNQLRHVRFLKDAQHISQHMAKHAEIIGPRFACVLDILESGLAGTGMAEWTKPEGGYFISFDSRPGLAKHIVGLANEIGVKVTPAGATFPYGDDPRGCNIRLAPTFPSLEDVKAAMQAFVVCVKLASVEQALTAD
ncbi:MAG: aspartate/methionine/tyrosine aminotransferase [Halioglobus sp.]|jgi:aspartate/methionine/tyrosine aminotransferase